MKTHAPGRLRRFVVIWTSATFIFAWLPLVRCIMDGASYEWGTVLFDMRFRGAGLQGDLWYLALQAALGVALVWMGWRRPRAPFPALALGWNALLAANALYWAFTRPELFRFEGATLGVDVSIALAAPAAYLIGALAAAAYVVRSGWSGESAAPEWSRWNTALLVAAAMLFPLQYALLSTGRGREMTDAVGVLLTMGQWVLVVVALYPWPARERVAVPAGASLA